MSHDGTELFYRWWPARSTSADTRAVMLFHRGHEHSGRLQHLVDELELTEYDFFAWDQRGHGRSPGARGDSPSFAACVKDVDAFVRHIAAVHGIASSEIAIVAQSMAAVVVLAWIHDYALRVRSVVITAPAFRVKLYVPFARAGLALLYRLRGNFFITSYVKPRLLTHDPERIKSYGEDPLVTRAISVRVLLGLLDTAERLVADAAAIRVPLLLLTSDQDWVVHRSPQEAFFERLGSAVKQKVLLRGFLHDTLGEQPRSHAIARVRGFILDRFEEPCTEPAIDGADKRGHTFTEFDALRKSLPVASWRNLKFAATRLSMRTLGRLSTGIRIGLANGFDSGSMLDYVYRNQASGRLLIGKLIDRGFLDAIGWRGIRVRKTHVARAVAAAAKRLHVAGTPIDLMDVAAGPGTYLVDALQASGIVPHSIQLRDYDDVNVAAAQAALAKSPYSGVGRAQRSDAFGPAAMASAQPRPSLVVVCGLYELYADNASVSSSLTAIARSIAPRGCLIYSGQPWHPQLELIARTLINHRDRGPWIMRRRTQAELDGLVAAAGFTKIEQWIDEWGMFTVSLAVRDV